MHLINNAEEQALMLSILENMKGLKPNKNYPWMAVSKIIHFFNPGLFPIWDNDIMWNMVMRGVFKQDYSSWCEAHGYRVSENSEKFNLNYLLWASENLSRADSGFMSHFSNWFMDQTGEHPDPNGVLEDVKYYYATAFEFVTIAAAFLLGK